MNLVAVASAVKSVMGRTWPWSKEATGADRIVYIERQPRAAVLRIVGPLTINHAAGVEKSLEQACRGDVPRVVVDLRGSPFVDTAGIALLVSGLRRARRVGKEFTLVGVGVQIQGVLQMVRLDGLFDRCASVQEALAD